MPAIAELASKPLSTERSSQALTDPAATTSSTDTVPTDPAATTAPTDRSSLPRTKPKREYLVKGTKFEVDSRYEVKKGIGQGAYGLVCRAQDTQSGDRVAIKKSTPRAAAASALCVPWRPARPVPKLTSLAPGRGSLEHRGRHRLQAPAP